MWKIMVGYSRIEREFWENWGTKEISKKQNLHVLRILWKWLKEKEKSRPMVWHLAWMVGPFTVAENNLGGDQSEAGR